MVLELQLSFASQESFSIKENGLTNILLAAGQKKKTD
jgi:hypothetical protein